MKISDRIASSRPLATTAMHGRVETLRNQGESVIDFSIAISHFPAPKPVLDAVAQAVERERTMPYTAVVGALQVREHLGEKLRKENEIEAGSEEIIVTCGAKQALYESLYVMTDPGDAVVIFKPHWPAYVATAQLLGLSPILVDLPEQVTPAFLDAIAPAKVVIINNPHNPTGKVFTRAELEHIRDWVERTGAQVIVDESYEHLAFEGRHTSFAATCDWRKIGVVTIFSASQSYAMMGWRVGFALAPKEVVSAMETLQGPITAAASHISQIAADAAFACGTPRAMMDDYRARRDLAVRHFAEVPWIDMHAPASGPYLWGDIRSLTMETVAFSERLLEDKRVAVMPGDALGVPGYIRLGYISDDVATLEEGIRRIIAFGDGYARAKQR
ncbi:aminotransferase class I/II-fold pyridoxal phosphate-dependent enzyme [Massilia solisilvae]|uniref:Aminotransferase class I/II-fold pyridoxal phosphate-dependent enzyme n=1 Tax=Massilia solisilvae TaxID=1811225 RepID=A0ABT2BGU0_9BURK|nr:aminotransferase class I/II-fold pyridoxal phosphate-dependent enzyme [Massilia solisilvae]MCS0607736.1 aminotransferase class I/II-fold pyridoxal phosphate-dependent enzyme [Massilia solisilvae]